MSRKNKRRFNDLTSSLLDNIDLISKKLDDSTLIIRQFENQKNIQIHFGILFFDGMVDTNIINDNIIEPLINNKDLEYNNDFLTSIKNHVLQVDHIRVVNTLEDMINTILEGDTLLLIDGFKDGLSITSRKLETRAIEEPQSERVIRGPHEGFTESILTNVNLIRKRIQIPELRFKHFTIGKYTKTKVCVCFIEGIANDKITQELVRRVKHLSMKAIIDSNYIEESIRDERLSPFKTMGSSERPDVIAASLLEGRVCLIVNGSPVVLTAPFLFIENLQSSEDYYMDTYYSSINRILRIIGFFCTISVPSIYLALITYHQEVIPTELLISIFASRQGIPFPTIVELLALLFVFEILREAGTRMPSNVGQALSIVGALVLGQAAVEARFVSAPMVIVVGFAGITSLMVPKLTGAVITIRLGLLFLTTLMGLYGYFFGISALLIYLYNMKSFGVSYMIKFNPNNLSDLQDTAIRAPWFMQSKQKDYLEDKES